MFVYISNDASQGNIYNAIDLKHTDTLKICQHGNSSNERIHTSSSCRIH